MATFSGLSLTPYVIRVESSIVVVLLSHVHPMGVCLLLTDLLCSGSVLLGSVPPLRSVLLIIK